MHPPILSRYIFNILYNVMTRLINWETFNTNDDEYLKLASCWHEADNLRSLQPLHHVSLQGKAQPSKSIMQRLSNGVVHHQSSTKGCRSRRRINIRLAYWPLLARQVRATTKIDEE